MVAFEPNLGYGAQYSWRRDACCELLLPRLRQVLDWPFHLFEPQCPVKWRQQEEPPGPGLLRG